MKVPNVAYTLQISIKWKSNSEQIPYEQVSVTTLNNMTYIQNTHRFRGFKSTFADWLKFSLIEELTCEISFIKALAILYLTADVA
jgi:hypothetical protein